MARPNPTFWHERRVTVTGGAGFLGTAVVRDLEQIGARVSVVRSNDHDLRDAAAARDAVAGADTVIHLAARVGGIGFNRRNPAPLVYDNLVIGANVFEQSRQAGVRKLTTETGAGQWGSSLALAHVLEATGGDVGSLWGLGANPYECRMGLLAPSFTLGL